MINWLRIINVVNVATVATTSMTFDIVLFTCLQRSHVWQSAAQHSWTTNHMSEGRTQSQDPSLIMLQIPDSFLQMEALPQLTCCLHYVFPQLRESFTSGGKNKLSKQTVLNRFSAHWMVFLQIFFLLGYHPRQYQQCGGGAYIRLAEANVVCRCRSAI